jgi:importin subunit alpha-1
MSHAENMIRKEAVWTLSNICAGNESQVKLIIELGIIDKLVQMTFSDVLDVQRESVWSLSNCTALKQPDIIRVLVEKDIIKAMSTWLEKNDSKTLVVILEGLTNILHVGKSTFGHSVF